MQPNHPLPAKRPRVSLPPGVRLIPNSSNQSSSSDAGPVGSSNTDGRGSSSSSSSTIRPPTTTSSNSGIEGSTSTVPPVNVSSSSQTVGDNATVPPNNTMSSSSGIATASSSSSSSNSSSSSLSTNVAKLSRTYEQYFGCPPPANFTADDILTKLLFYFSQRGPLPQSIPDREATLSDVEGESESNTSVSAQQHIDRLLAQNQGLQGRYDKLLKELRRT